METIVRLNTKLITNLQRVLYMQVAEMVEATKLASATYYYILKKPEDISVQQLLAISNGLHIPVRRFFSEGEVDVIGRRDDYVAEPYLPCQYDEKTLQKHISRRNNSTWQRAAEITGMNSFRLRNSLLAVTRTPVNRFLTVCEIFGIDPFTILIDPNPRQEASPRQKQPARTQRGKDADPTAAEIALLRSQMESLNASLNDLTEKYENLAEMFSELNRKYAAMIRDQKEYLRSVSMNIDTNNGSVIGFAAEPLGVTQ